MAGAAMTSTDNVAGLTRAGDQDVDWLHGIAAKGGKGVVNNIDARSLGRIGDRLESQANALREMEVERDMLRSYKPLYETCKKALERSESERDTLRARLKEAEAEAKDWFGTAAKNSARALRAEQQRDELQGMLQGMLLLCGELGGIGKNEAPIAYLRRLIDGLIDAGKQRDEAYERAAKVAERDADQASDQIDRNNEYADRTSQSRDCEPTRLCRHREHHSREIAVAIRRLASDPEGGVKMEGK